MNELVIHGRRIGPRHPVYVIAEVGINHNGDEGLATRLIEHAAAAGADAVKFQSFRAEHLVSRSAAAPLHVRGFTSATLFDFFRSVELGAKTLQRLKARADEVGVTFLATPFDEEMVDLLDTMQTPAFKICSGDLTHFPLLAHAARKGKPLLLSTGMADLAEVDKAVNFLGRNGAPPVALLHCVSAYPAPEQDLNLRAIRTLAERFNLPVGYSDHSVDPMFALGAVSCGACVLEEHLTLDRTLPGPDQALSREPAELKALVGNIRRLEAALGDGEKRPAASELENRRLSRRGLVARQPVHAGQIVEPQMLSARRPALGISPDLVEGLVGRTWAHNLAAGKAIEWSDIA